MGVIIREVLKNLEVGTQIVMLEIDNSLIQGDLSLEMLAKILNSASLVQDSAGFSLGMSIANSSYQGEPEILEILQYAFRDDWWSAPIPIRPAVNEVQSIRSIALANLRRDLHQLSRFEWLALGMNDKYLNMILLHSPKAAPIHNMELTAMQEEMLRSDIHRVFRDTSQLSTKAGNSLARNGYPTVASYLFLTQQQLQYVRGFGRKSKTQQHAKEQVFSWLTELGLSPKQIAEFPAFFE